MAYIILNMASGFCLYIIRFKVFLPHPCRTDDESFPKAIRKVWYISQHCENDKLPWFKSKIFLCKAKCCLSLHRAMQTLTWIYTTLSIFTCLKKHRRATLWNKSPFFSYKFFLRRDRGGDWNSKGLVVVCH